MSKKAQKIEVIKVPTERPISRPKKFPPMNRMYLELMENKEKIKQDLVNKEYNPAEGAKIQVEPEASRPLEEAPQPAPSEPPRVYDSESDEEEVAPAPSRRPSSSASSSSSSSSSSSRDVEKYEKAIGRYDDSDSDDNSDKRSDSGSDYSSSSSSSDDDSDDRASESSDSDSDDDYGRSSGRSSPDDSELAKRLRQLLSEDDSSRDSSRHNSRKRHAPSSNKPPTPPPVQAAPVVQPQPTYAQYEPPSLAQLESSGVFQSKKVLPDLAYNNSASEEEDEDKKRELLFKFDILKKSYKDATVPEFTIHSDYTTMVRSYDLTLRKVSLDSTVDTYKQYLVGGFMVVEYVFGKFFNFDMQGFTQQQMVSMSSYERLLIEMGEKSYVPGESKWPVELRLLFLVIINAAVFLLTKMVMKKTGSNLFGVLNSLGGMTSSVSGSQAAPQRKKKMQGPSINLDDMPDM